MKPPVLVYVAAALGVLVVLGCMYRLGWEEGRREYAETYGICLPKDLR